MIYLDNYTKKCKSTLGGIKRAYLMEYVFYNETLIKSDGMSLTQFPETLVYEFDCTGDYSQDSSFENGNVSFNQIVNLNLSKVYNVLDAHIFTDKDFRVIVETNNDDLILFGTNNGLVGSMTNSTGTEKSEFNGFNVTFTGLEEKTGLLIDELTDFFTIYDDENGFNYDFNFNL